MRGPDCVPEGALRAFLLGELLEPIAGAVADHLEGCPACEEAARRLDGLTDTTLRALRRGFGADDGAGGSADTTLPRSAAAAPGPPPPVVAGYAIEGELGRGGMGVVYKARQLRPARTVALKVILSGAHADPERRARFLAEADAVARLRHPHIVGVYEAGESGGLPFVALEHVGGGSLAQKLAAGPLSAKQAAELAEKLARAVHHAHRAGVVHRDLKPSNILLTEEGEPKVTDFGLAKQGDAGLTATGAVLGTPSYMAPEQAAGDNRAVGPAADVYALGAILYECLTGRPPFQAATPLETLEQVASREPVPPSHLQPKVPRDLSTVCLKCLRKEPAKRYASALELADELRRFLAGQPIRARPARGWERAAKWARRRPGLALLLGLVVAVTALGTGGVFWQWLRAEAALGDARNREAEAVQARQAEAAQRGRAEAALGRAETALYYHRLALAERLWAENNVARVEQMLDLCRPEQRGWEWHYLRRLCRGHHHTLRGHTGAVFGLAFSPDGRRLASAAYDGTVRLWDAAGPAAAAVLRGHTARVYAVAFRPDGRLLASASADRTVRLWDAASGQTVATLRGHADRVLHVAFRPDGRLLASASADRTVCLWDVAAGREVLRLAGHTGPVEGVAFSPDGRRVASASRDGTARVWDAATGAAVVTFAGHEQTSRYVFRVAFTPDGRRVVSASWNSVRIWDAATGREYLTLPEHSNGVQSMALSPDGRSVLTGSPDQTVKVWDATSGAEVRTLRGHTGSVTAVAVAPDGRVATGGTDQTVLLWGPGPEPGPRTVCQDTAWLYGVAFSPDGRLLAVASPHVTAVDIWDLAAGRRRHRLERHTKGVHGVAFSPDGDRLASAGDDGTVRVWEVASGRQLRALSGLAPGAVAVAFSPDGRRLAATTGRYVEHAVPGTVKVWDAASGQELAVCRGDASMAMGLAFSPNGRFVAAGLGDFERADVHVWDAATGEPVRRLAGHRGLIAAVAFSPDGRWLASASDDRNVRLWEADTGRCVRVCLGHTNWSRAVAFSPDGRRLASAGADQTVRLWDTATGQQTLVLRGHTAQVLGVAFSPDGRQLASCGADGRALLWDATPRPRAAAGGWAVEEGGLSVSGVGYAADGQTLATAYEDGTVRLRDLGTGWERPAFPERSGRGPSLLFTGAGPPLLAGSAAGSEGGVRLLDATTGRERGHLPGPFIRLTAAALAPDGRTLATVEANRVRFWDAHTGEAKGTFRAPDAEGDGGRFTAAAFSAEGRALAVGRQDGALVLGGADGAAGAVVLGTHRGAVTAVLFTADGRSLLSGGEDGCVRFWDLAARREYAKADVQSPVRCLAPYPGGRVLAVGDAVGLVRLLDLETRGVCATLEGPTAFAQALAVSPDGQSLCLGSAGGTVKLWPLAGVLDLK